MEKNKVLPDVPVLPGKRPLLSECFVRNQEQIAAVSSFFHVAIYSHSRCSVKLSEAKHPSWYGAAVGHMKNDKFVAHSSIPDFAFFIVKFH